MENEYRIKLRWLIIVATVIRCIFASFMELGNDEVYYFTYAQQLDWNHFDHPPMVGLVIRFFTLNLHWVNEFSMRLGAIALSAFNTWLIARIACQLMSPRAGLIAAILYTASLYSSIISGLFILPDSVANTFWLASLWSMLCIVNADDSRTKNNQLLLLGLWIGMACLSKVHAISLWVGFFAYVLIFDRRFFGLKNFYFSMLITGICILPILVWNCQHEFITWKFHGERVHILDSGFRWDFFAQAFFGQLFYNNPFLVYLYVVILVLLFKNRLKIYGLSTKSILLLLCCSLPIIALTMGLSLFRQTLPHWSGAGFFALMLISAFWIDRRVELNSIPKIRKILNLQLSFTLVVMLLAVLAIKWYPGNLFAAANAEELGKGDVTLDMFGWQDLMEEFAQVRSADIQQGAMRAEDVLLVDNWYPAGHYYFYIARPLGIRTIAIGKLTDIHKFAWLNLTEPPIQQHENAYYIAPSNTFRDPVALYADLFEEIRLHKTLEQRRGNRVIRHWYIYQLKGAKQVLGDLKPQQYPN